MSMYLPNVRPPGWQRAKLTTADRTEICRRYTDGETAVSLAAEFHVSTAAIREVVPARNPGAYR